MTRVVAIVQARMGSTRLPGKVLLDVAGAPMLARVLERARAAKRVDAVAVATTTEPGDEPIIALCERLAVPVFRGSESDVLGRYLGAARAHAADVVVRITSDCPLLDATLVDALIEARERGGFDYASNTLEPRRIPRGLDAEVFTRAALETAAAGDTEPASREHVTPFLYRHPERFRLGRVDIAEDLSAHRWTVDTPEDLTLVRRVYEAAGGAPGGYRDVLALVAAHPEWRALNAHVVQKTVP